MSKRKKTIKKPGDPIPLRLSKNENPWILEWLNHQSIPPLDCIRYLIEKHIDESNGILDLGKTITMTREWENFDLNGDVYLADGSSNDKQQRSLQGHTTVNETAATIEESYQDIDNSITSKTQLEKNVTITKENQINHIESEHPALVNKDKYEIDKKDEGEAEINDISIKVGDKVYSPSQTQNLKESKDKKLNSNDELEAKSFPKNNEDTEVDDFFGSADEDLLSTYKT